MNHQVLFLTHLFVTLMMTGLIWVIQLVHYPAFRYIERRRFSEFEQFHTRNISLLVVPLMCLELLTGFALVALEPELRAPLTANLGLIAIIWLSTLLVSSRIHTHLIQGFDRKAIKRLVSTNWIRTILWSTRSLLLMGLLLSLGVSHA